MQRQGFTAISATMISSLPFSGVPESASFIMENTVTVRFILMREDPPITAIFTEYKAVFTIIPASRLSTPSLVCRIAVTKPDSTPASIAAITDRNGLAADCHDSTYGCSKSKAAVSGKIADIQHRVAKKQSKDSQRTDQSQLQGCLSKGEHGCNRHGKFLQLVRFYFVTVQYPHSYFIFLYLQSFLQW